MFHLFDTTLKLSEGTYSSRRDRVACGLPYSAGAKVSGVRSAHLADHLNDFIRRMDNHSITVCERCANTARALRAEIRDYKNNY